MTISSLPPFFHIIIHSRKPKKTEMMVSHPLPLLLSPHLHSTLLAFFVLYLIVLPSFSSSESEDEANYKICKERYDCGLLQNLSYPFWGRNNRPQVCGHQGFELNCEESRHPVLMRDGPELMVLNISQASKQMTLARLDFLEFGLCPLRDAVNTSLNEALFRSNPQENTLLNLVYNCSSVPDIHKQSVLSCPSRRDGFFYEGIINEVSTLESVKNLECDTVVVQVPVPRRDLDSDGLQGVGEVETLVRLGFNVSYEYEPDFSVCDQCVHSGGVCGTNLTSLGFACFCRNKSFPSNCPTGEKMNIRRKVIIAATSIIGTVAVMFTIFCFWLRRNKNKYPSSYFVSRSIVSNPPPKTDVEKGENSYHGVHLFTYAELEEATNHFDESRELGDGGFGTVYYGKLRDGRVVAVKRLYENNFKRVEQFKNEIEILAGLRHDHLVSLHGCTSRHSRELLLVYDYISNGTVADHLHGERAKPGSLPWGIRMKIAIETATALAYLHASDIIHRDVKTNNILLDDNFCVKVADFGLSRLFPTNVTHVSTAPQGTPGYVDPEYHECYQLTSKSDVYSFGVVLVELISSLPAVDITRHRHEINLSNMAVTKIQSDALHELVDSSLGFETDYMVTRMISGVAELAFQCLQCAKDMRPTMDKVLEVLKEIQNNSTPKAEEIDIPSDDVGLLKSGSPSLSPDSVTAKWNISSSTTPNASG